MPSRYFTIPWMVVVWLVVGVVVAINKGYGDTLDGAAQVMTFVLAVFMWPIPASDGLVLIQF